MAQLTINSDWCPKRKLSVCTPGFSQKELEIRYLTEFSQEKNIRNYSKPLVLFMGKMHLKNLRQNQNIFIDFIYKKITFPDFRESYETY